MTDNPNSVCKRKGCVHPPAVHDHLGCAMIGCTCKQFTAEPVDEASSPAEPSLCQECGDPAGAVIHLLEPDDPVGHKFNPEPSAEPTAEQKGPYVNWKHGDPIPSPAGKYAPATERPTDVSASLKKCVKEGPDCDCVGVCKFDAAQSVSAAKVEEVARKVAEGIQALMKEGPTLKTISAKIADILRPYFTGASQPEWANIICGACQIMDAWKMEESWSDYDRGIRAGMSEILEQLYAVGEQKMPLREALKAIKSALEGSRDNSFYCIEVATKALAGWNGLREPPTAEPLENQVDKLANFIMTEIPGEPSQSEGAIDCAIRLLKKLATPASTGEAGKEQNHERQRDSL